MSNLVCKKKSFSICLPISECYHLQHQSIEFVWGSFRQAVFDVCSCSRSVRCIKMEKFLSLRKRNPLLQTHASNADCVNQPLLCSLIHFVCEEYFLMSVGILYIPLEQKTPYAYAFWCRPKCKGWTLEFLLTFCWNNSNTLTWKTIYIESSKSLPILNYISYFIKISHGNHSSQIVQLMKHAI